MPYIPDPGPEAIEATALLLYAVAYRASLPGGIRIPRQALWDLLTGYPALAANVGGRLDFYAALRTLADAHPDAIRLVTSTGSRVDVVLHRDLRTGARGYGLMGLGHGEVEEEDALHRRGLEPHLSLPADLGVSDRLPRLPGGPKRCSRCQMTKPASEFNKRGPNGLQPRCRACQKADAQARSGKTKDGKPYEETRSPRDRRVERPGMTFGGSTGSDY